MRDRGIIALYESLANMIYQIIPLLDLSIDILNDFNGRERVLITKDFNEYEKISEELGADEGSYACFHIDTIYIAPEVFNPRVIAHELTHLINSRRRVKIDSNKDEELAYKIESIFDQYWR